MTTGDYAGFYPRMMAHNIDLVILLPFFYLIGNYVSQDLVLFILCYLTYIFYNTLFEVSTWSASVGKRVQKIKVASDSSNTSLNFASPLIRNSSKILSALLFFSGFLMVIFDKKKRGLHDRIAGTVVIFF